MTTFKIDIKDDRLRNDYGFHDDSSFYIYSDELPEEYDEGWAITISHILVSGWEDGESILYHRESPSPGVTAVGFSADDGRRIDIVPS